MDLHNERPSISIDHGVALAAQQFLARIIAAWATGFSCLDARLSITAAEGLASRPTRSRSCAMEYRLDT